MAENREFKSSQDLVDVSKLLAEKTKEYEGTDKHLGLTLMTFPQYISSTRSIMFTSHLKQFNTLNEPQFPRVFTNYENIFGKNSSGLVKARSNYTVVKKIDKFADRPGYIFATILYDEDNDFYDIIFKKQSEDLTENFGYVYNNENLDNLQEGDSVKKGDVLYKTTSYDEDDNYCYGRNAKTAYILDPDVIEDAYVVSESFARSMVSRKVDTVKVSINDNDFLLDLYGNDEEGYKGFPDIGEEVSKRIICTKRRIQNTQILYDMKKSNMKKISPLNDKPFFTKGWVTDIDIYSNKEVDEIPRTEYNEQIIYYLENQNRYYQELFDICEEILESGSKYSDDIGFIYRRAKNILDPDYKWKDNDTVFNNIIIDFRVDRDVRLFKGSKITGRYGDKGVVSVIRPDDEMPFDKNGNRLDVICNPLSCINRLNSFQWIELSLNHCANQLIEQMKEMKSNSERFKALSEFMFYFNERGEKDELEKYYKSLSSKEKDEFFESIYEEGIFINYPPMWEGMPAVKKIEELYDKFGFTRDQLFIHRWGRTIPLLSQVIVGEKYMIKLKQTSEKNFSARSTGYLSQKGLPEKSNKVRTNEQLYSTTPITVGRDENNNLGIGVRPFILSKFHLFYRTSPFARKQVGKLFTNDVLDYDKFKIKDGYKNRNVEILNAEMKAIGANIDFGFSGLTLDIDDEKMNTYTYKDEIHFRTKAEMREILLDDLLRPQFDAQYDGPESKVEKAYAKFKKEAIENAQQNLTRINDEIEELKD